LRYAVNSELAEGDLADIWVEIATADIDTADHFIEELRTVAQKLAEQPFMGRERPELGQDVRVFPHGRYLLIYRPAGHGVGIARVVHGARELTSIEVPRTDYDPGRAPVAD
jgi:toxin ParE1/3/4